MNRIIFTISAGMAALLLWAGVAVTAMAEETQQKAPPVAAVDAAKGAKAAVEKADQDAAVKADEADASGSEDETYEPPADDEE